MLRKVLVSVILISGFLLLGGGAAALLIANRPPAEQRPDEQRKLIVDGVTLQPQTVVEPLVGYGTARADRYAWLSAEVSGEVVEISPRLRVGEAVEPGDLLIAIDDRTYRESLARARGLLAADEAQLAMLDVEQQNTQRLLEVARSEQQIADRELERVAELFEQKMAPQREFDLARGAAEAAKRQVWTLDNRLALIPQQRAAAAAARDAHRAEVALAEIDVARCRLAAPFAGRLETVDVEQGERVQPGTKLLALLDPVHIEVPIELPVSVRSHVQVGAAARLSIDSGQEVWRARVARIAPSANQQTRTFALFLDVDNREQPQPILPGMFVRATIDGPRHENALLAPRSAIERDQVFVFENGRARRRSVSVAANLLDRSVVSGLEAGSVLITTHLDSLVDGAAVEVRPVELPLARDLIPEPGIADSSARPAGGG